MNGSLFRKEIFLFRINMDFETTEETKVEAVEAEEMAHNPRKRTKGQRALINSALKEATTEEIYHACVKDPMFIHMMVEDYNCSLKLRKFILDAANVLLAMDNKTELQIPAALTSLPHYIGSEIHVAIDFLLVNWSLWATFRTKKFTAALRTSIRKTYGSPQFDLSDFLDKHFEQGMENARYYKKIRVGERKDTRAAGKNVKDLLLKGILAFRCTKDKMYPPMFPKDKVFFLTGNTKFASEDPDGKVEYVIVNEQGFETHGLQFQMRVQPNSMVTEFKCTVTKTTIQYEDHDVYKIMKAIRVALTLSNADPPHSIVNLVYDYAKEVDE